ncbi:MAG: vWA domain-containing protein [Phycisphaerales bacterium]
MTPTLSLTFANWQAGAIAAGIAIPTLLILYFLKLRRRDVEISTTLLWKKAIEDLQANAPFQRLRKNLLLFLQLLALAAALVGIAQPQIDGRSLAGERHLILIDASASMNALDAKGKSGAIVSRLDAAKEQAIDLVDAMAEPGWLNKESGDRAMVIAFDRSARALQTFTNDKRELRTAIESIRPTDAPSSIEEAWRLVEAQAPRIQRTETTTLPDGTTEEKSYDMPPGPVGTIHLFSDGRLPDSAMMTPRPEDGFIYHAVGTDDAPNIGITSLRAGRAFDDPTRLSVFVGLQNTDTRPRSTEVELLLDGVPVRASSVDLGAAAAAGFSAAASPPAEGAPASATPQRTPGTGGVVFSLDRPEGAVVTVRLVRGSAADVLASDDAAWIVVPPAKKLSIAVVTTGSLFLTNALEALPLAKLDQMPPARYEAILKEGRAADYDVVVLDRWLPPADAEGVLPPGRYLIFGAIPPPPLGPVELDEATGATVIDWRRDHPVLRNVSLDNLFITTLRRVEVPKGNSAAVLATSDAGPVILELAEGGTRAILVTFDPNDSAWPLDWGLVVFVASSAGYLGGDDAAASRTFHAGDVLADQVPKEAADIQLTAPDESRSAHMPASDGTVNFGYTRRVGVYTAMWTGPAGPRDGKIGDRVARPYAVNLLDADESDAGVAQDLALGSRVVQGSARDAGRATQRLWPWLLLAALFVIMFEWYIYNRKVQL